MKTTDKYHESSPLVEIAVSDPSSILRRKGTAADGPLRTATIRRSDIGSWEEVPASEAAEEAAAEQSARQSEAEYAAEVERLIRARYSLSAELAVLRQRDSKPDEFAAYDSFAERCKAQARAYLAARDRLADALPLPKPDSGENS